MTSSHEITHAGDVPTNWDGNAIPGTVWKAINQLASRTATVEGGYVTGPASSTDRSVVIFDGTTGKAVRSQPSWVIDSNEDLAVATAKTIIFDADGSSDHVILSDGSGLRVQNNAASSRITLTDSSGIQVVGDNIEMNSNRINDIGRLTGGGTAIIVDDGITMVGGGSHPLNMNSSDIEGAGDVECDSLTKDGAGDIAVNDNLDLGGNLIKGWPWVRTTSDETKNSDTTLAIDPVLQFTPAASAVYEIGGTIIFDLDTTPQLKLSWNFPTGATGRISYHAKRLNSSGLSGAKSISVTSNGAVSFVPTANALFSLDIQGILIMSSTVAAVGPTWAQNVSDAAATTRKADSFLKWRELET